MRPTSPPKGFSLLEVLVVLAIVGLLLGTTTLSFRQMESRRLQEEGERLSLVIAAVSDRAALLNRRHRLTVDADGYRVEERQRGEWRLVQESPLQARAWSHGVRPDQPGQVTTDGVGLLTPAEFRLVRAADQLSVQVNALAEVRLAAAP
ncbi:MAG: hypothetical protein RLY30_278 [Pseudomonadota bacterium]